MNGEFGLSAAAPFSRSIPRPEWQAFREEGRIFEHDLIIELFRYNI